MTPAVKLLEKLKVPHEVHRYEVSGDEQGTYGEAVAAAIGAEPDRVFKTLVAKLDSGELVVGIVPVSASLDLGALAKAAGAKKASMAPPAEAEKATGYVTGGISPFGQRKRLRTFVDASMQRHDRVFVSGGRRGIQVELSPADLVRVCDAEAAPLAK
jgi:Cys-tRNA(Pro)/Cys-tRNA(Cys) deacylase